MEDCNDCMLMESTVFDLEEEVREYEGILNLGRFKALRDNNFNCLCTIDPTPCMCDTFRQTGKCKCGVWK